MGETGGAAPGAMVGTPLGMASNRAHVKGTSSWKRILLLVASCFWFCITASLSFSIRFMSRRLFRVRREEDGSWHGDLSSAPTRALEEDVDASEEQEAPVFQFRFSFQVPEESLSRGEVQGNCYSGGEGTVPSMTTSISNYRFASERDLKGFMETPPATTMCFQESYMGSGGVVLVENTEELDGELRSRFSTLKCSEKANSDAGEAVREEGEVNNGEEVGVDNTEELDTELRNRFSAVKSSCQPREAGHGGAVCQLLDSDGPCNAEELDRELRTRLLAVKSPPQACSAAAAAVHGEQEVGTSSCSDGDVLDNSEELDREITTWFLSVKSSNPAGCSSPSASCRTEEEPLPREVEPVIQFADQEHQLQNVSSPTRARFLTERVAGELDSDTVSESISDGYSVKDLNVDSDSDGFLSERDFESEIDEEDLFELDRENEKSLECNQGSEETQLPGSPADSAEDMIMYNILTPTALHDDVLRDGEAELDLGQEPGTPNPKSDKVDRKERRAPPVTDHSHNSQTSEAPVNPDHLLEENSYGQGQRWEDPLKVAHSQESSNDSQGTHLSKAKELSMEESEELESLWEHQDLIDQLKMELKKVRSIGLPTILEESESPKPTDGLKPWKFDAKFLHEDPMDEQHKFYKSYRERMRKFDILNYQKMYAVGFLQLKDHLHPIGIHKPSIPTITSIFSHNIWPRRRKCGTDPSEKFAKELQSDLETVYVGQSCLSWEFLRWQYERTRELLDCNSEDCHQYNQVAGEFQQFQVLIQRFLEDEPFQGPRVPNYVRNRCVLRSLLQVPVIREDCLRDNIEEQSKWDEAVTSAQLEYVMESSMRVFWEFVKADKGDTPMIMKGLIGSPAELQDPVDRELMAGIQSNLQKKEKKLKDILKTSGCLMKKFKKPRDGRSIQDDLFFSQVDLKLVSRVLKMARITTDQLVWCNKKLSKITFVGRKLVRKPSFLLFPC